MQIEIKDEAKLKDISEKADEYADNIISFDCNENWKSIYDLKLENLKLQHGLSELNLQMMQREKKREKQHEEIVEKLNVEIAELKEKLQIN